MNCLFIFLTGVALNWTLADGKKVTERVDLSLSEGNEGSIETLFLSKEKILSMNAVRLDIIPDFALAEKGEKGYWFTPYGIYGEYDRDNGSFFAAKERMNMPMFGWSNPRGSFLAIVTSLKYFVRETISVKNGKYSVAATLEEQLCQDPYEDLVIEYHRRDPGTSYATLAKIYRTQQLKNGIVKPFKERFKENKILEQAILAPEIRIRQAWKPVPSPVWHQAPENEPEVKAAVTFDRVKDIVNELSAQGVKDAELCLVGWNIGGHDGRYPQVFPSEPKLGGDEKLKEAIQHALSAGYLIVPHSCFYSGYTISEDWDGEWTIKDKDGFILPSKPGDQTWGGGKPYFLCPVRAYEKFCTRDIPRMAAFGFKGIGYFDVVTICEPHPCKDPRHPCTTAEGAKYWGACAALSKRELGGFSSESGNDYFAENLDFSLYTYFGDPQKIETEYKNGSGIAKRVIPIWEIVYNGIIACNPFTTTMNSPIKDRYTQLKAIEFSSRPSFYFYAKFLTVGENWMGNEDLGCETDEQLKWSVSQIKKSYDEFQKLKHLQLEFIEDHYFAAPGVSCTAYSNGQKILVNYNNKTVKVQGVTVPANDYILY